MTAIDPRCGIDSISVNPDVIDQARCRMAAAEQRTLLSAARGTSNTPDGGSRP